MRTVLSLLTLFYSVLLFAQTKVDVVYMLNGTEHRGHVAKVTATDIVFVHEEETIEYSYPRADIFKIVFASGRQELFNAQQASGDTGASMQASSSTTAPPGSVAILPFRFIADASPSPNEELARLIQDECFRIFNSQPGGHTYQDPMKTNAILAKHGISIDQVRDHSGDELSAILGVEMVVMGVVARNTKGATTSGSSGGYTGVKEKSDTKTDIWNVNTGSSTTTVNYETSITLTLVDNTGQRVFDKEHKSFWSTSDAYKTTITWLWKKSPLYPEH
jgi:hypothetical protein